MTLKKKRFGGAMIGFLLCLSGCLYTVVCFVSTLAECLCSAMVALEVGSSCPANCGRSRRRQDGTLCMYSVSVRVI